MKSTPEKWNANENHLKSEKHMESTSEKWKAYEKHTWKVKSTLKVKNTWKVPEKWKAHEMHTWKVKSTWLKSEKHMKSTPHRWKAHEKYLKSEKYTKSTWNTCAPHCIPSDQIKMRDLCWVQLFLFTKTLDENALHFSRKAPLFTKSVALFERPLARNYNPMFFLIPYILMLRFHSSDRYCDNDVADYFLQLGSPPLLWSLLMKKIK